MSRGKLSGSWQFRQAASEAWLPATAPGNVHLDLLAAGQISDPFVSDNEKQAQWVAENDWEYRRGFNVAADLAAHDRLYLVCDGLDTLADIYLNGQALGRADNMFRQYCWEVTPWLREGENELRLLFRSPVRYVTECERSRSLCGVGGWKIAGASYLRKAPCHFGWDWGPMLPTLGIWRDIRLEGYRGARLAETRVRQQHTNGQVTLIVAAAIEQWTPAPLQIEVQLLAPDGQTQTVTTPLVGDSTSLSLPIEQPRLWQPNGYGSQPLYQVNIALQQAGVVLDQRSIKIGLRTLELCQQPDEWGRSFTFVVNGAPIFAKGANWIPADSFPARISPAQLEQLLGSAAAAHHNMIRVWGGGYYEDDYFYELCDRYGLLVWQDFMFACAAYPMHEAAFLENLKLEVVEVVRRLRHHACLALWCGNNEMEEGWVQWRWTKPENADLKVAYEQFFHHLLPEWVKAEDPDTAYWPSSPSSGETPFIDPNGGRAGDMHQWAVWHALQPFRSYRETAARFVSEFGFQSLPSLTTIATYAEPAEWNMTSYVMEHHQRHPNGNGKIITYLTAHFRLPKDFASLVYLTQLLQAEGIRLGVEHWRRHSACSGTLYWQLNDCWPVASWSSIDYYGRWKALHYASRRFYAPVLLSVEENEEQLQLFVSNDTLTPWAGEVRWALETLAGEQVEKGRRAVTAAPGATAVVETLDFPKRLTAEQRRRLVLVSELWQGEVGGQRCVTPFAPSKHLKLEDPRLTLETQLADGQLTFAVEAQSLARFVELALDGADPVFSDNYFDLPARRPVRVSCPLPAGWTAERARQAVKVRSLFDSF